MTGKPLPLAFPDLTGNEEAYVVEAIRSSWISSTGPFVARFEREFAALCGTRAAIAVTNGTVALHLALMTLGLKPGDEVIVPSLTYIATANAVRYVGAEPVFVDVDPRTWCLDPAALEAAITDRTRGVIAVHLYGHPADMDAINMIAAARGLWVVEDAAEAPLALYKGRPTGGLGDIGTFSFYGNKVFTSGEGGAVTLDDEAYEKTARLLRGQGMDPNRRYYFPVVGYNYRMTNVACAIACAQLERRTEFVGRRRAIMAAYHDRLAGVAGIGFQPVAEWAVVTPWLMNLTVDEAKFGMSRDALMEGLARVGIETRPFFIPLHVLPPYREAAEARGCRLPVTDQLARTGVNLPTYNTMTDDDIGRVADAIKELAR